MLMRTAGNQCWMRSEPSGKSWDASNTDEGDFAMKTEGKLMRRRVTFVRGAEASLAGDRLYSVHVVDVII